MIKYVPAIFEVTEVGCKDKPWILTLKQPSFSYKVLCKPHRKKWYKGKKCF